MNLPQTLARLALLASLLVPALLPTAHAAKKGVGDSVNLKPSIIGGEPLQIDLYNFTADTVTGYWVTPEGILQSLPGAPTLAPTGTKPVTINSFRLATIYLQRPQGGGMGKHFGGRHPDPFIIIGTPPDGFREKLKRGSSSSPTTEVSSADEASAPAGKKKVVKNAPDKTKSTTTIVTPPVAPGTPAAGSAPAAAAPARGQGKGPRATRAEIAEFLRIHNAARKDVGVSPLAWSADLAQSAQAWADQLARTGKLAHQPDAKYGENLGSGTGDYSPATAANAWLAEKAQYDPAAPEPKGKKAAKRDNPAKALHYTQMVWGKSAAVGYGVAETADGRTIVVAHYNPRGNVAGELPFAPKP